MNQTPPSWLNMDHMLPVQDAHFEAIAQLHQTMQGSPPSHEEAAEPARHRRLAIDQQELLAAFVAGSEIECHHVGWRTDHWAPLRAQACNCLRAFLGFDFSDEWEFRIKEELKMNEANNVNPVNAPAEPGTKDRGFNHLLVGKTIASVDSTAINEISISFTDGTVVSIRSDESVYDIPVISAYPEIPSSEADPED